MAYKSDILISSFSFDMTELREDEQNDNDKSNDTCTWAWT